MKTDEAKTTDEVIAQKKQSSSKGNGEENFTAKTFFITANNPEKYGFTGNPQEICDSFLEKLLDGHSDREAIVSYNLAPTTGTPHIHAALSSKQTMRMKKLRELFPHASLEVAKGKKTDILDYIKKTPGTKYADKGEIVLATAESGGFQHSSESGMTMIEEMYECIFGCGMTVDEACQFNPKFFSRRSVLKEMWNAKMREETPIEKEMTVTWHYGKAGSGKSYTQVKLKEELGKNQVYVVSDYSTGGFDHYDGQPVLFMDEFKGDMSFAAFLQIIDIYSNEMHARYVNVPMTWDTVHIASIIPPERIFSGFQQSGQETAASIEAQIRRRIHFLVYHWKDSGQYLSLKIPMEKYKDCVHLHVQVLGAEKAAVLYALGFEPKMIEHSMNTADDATGRSPWQEAIGGRAERFKKYKFDCVTEQVYEAYKTSSFFGLLLAAVQWFSLTGLLPQLPNPREQAFSLGSILENPEVDIVATLRKAHSEIMEIVNAKHDLNWMQMLGMSALGDFTIRKLQLGGAENWQEHASKSLATLTEIIHEYDNDFRLRCMKEGYNEAFSPGII